jgi:catecholate siderophore receptor
MQNHITKSPLKPRSLSLIINTLLAGLGSNLMLPGQLLAQSARPLEEILVTDNFPGSGYRVDQSSVLKLTEALRDTPQSITTISRELLEDRAAMSLNDALRNVPGITLGAGEFTWQGNNPTIRGFNSRNDMFLDGMRDQGNYLRDPFNLETIEVLQGPSSMVFGRGSTGGVINQSSKQPLANTKLRRFSLNMGNAALVRASADINEPLQQLGEDSAFRLNLMRHSARVPGRDHTETENYGIAPSLSLGLSQVTRLTLSYMKQKSDSIPDYGFPWLHGQPAPVDRKQFFGFQDDFVNTVADIANIQLDHHVSSDFSINAQLRHAQYRRESRIGEPLIAGTPPPATALTDILINRNTFGGRSTESMLQGQINLLVNLETGMIRHSLVAGVEMAREASRPTMGIAVGVPPTTLLNPSRINFTADRMQTRAQADTTSDSLAYFILDTMKFGEQWQLVSGLRWDRFDTDYQAQRFAADGSSAGPERVLRKDIEYSYRAALVYKPVEAGTFYLGWGTSFNPSAEALSFIANARNFGISNAFLEPEQNRSLELGTKWDMFNSLFTAEAAVFRISKENARVPDPANPGFNVLAGEQRVDGLSVNLAGNLSQRFSLSGGYTYLDSQEVRTAASLNNLGQPLLNVPKHNFSMWANLAVSQQIEIGAGARHVGERLARNVAPLLVAPGYWAFDAMGKYTISDHWTVKFNLTNITDRVFFDQLHPFHVVPGPGLSGVLAVSYAYF